jgi:signal peptidase II
LCGLQEWGVVATLTPARSRIVASTLTVAVVVADRLSTTWAEHHVHGVTHVWGPFGFELSFNSGFAFSLFSGNAVPLTILLCIGVTAVAVAVSRVRTGWLAIGGGLLLGGALGNLSERLFSSHQGQVADFITLSHWPTFNVADACITVGAVVVAVTLLFERPSRVEGT